MGKGEIISHVGDGQYQIKILYDTAAKEAAIERIDAKLDELRELVEQLTVKIECQA